MFQNMKISTRLHISFWFTIVLVIIVGVFAVFQTHTLFKLTAHLYDYSSITKSDAVHDAHINVIDAVHNTHINIIKVLSHIKEVTIKGNVDLESVKQTVTSYEARIRKSLDIIERNFFGDKRKLDNVKNLFEEWKSIRNHVIALLKRGDVNEVVDYMFRGKGAKHVAKLEEAVEKLHDFMDAETYEFLEQSHSIALESLWVSVGIVMIILIGGWIVFAISRKVIKNVALAAGIAEAMTIVNSRDHFQYKTQGREQFLQKLEAMQVQLRESLQEISQIEIQVREEKKRQLEEEQRLASETIRDSHTLDKAFTGFFLEESELE